MNILETQFYYISTASWVKVKRNRAALPCTHIYICISEWRNIKKFSAKKSTHKKSEVEGKRTHQESRYGFDVEKRKKKGKRELDEPLSSKTSKKTEREKKEVKQEKCRSEYRKKSKFLIRREENIYSWGIWKEILKRNWRNHRDQAKVSEREKEKKQYRGCLHFKRAQGQRPRKYF